MIFFRRVIPTSSDENQLAGLKTFTTIPSILQTRFKHFDPVRFLLALANDIIFGVDESWILLVIDEGICFFLQ